MRFRAPALMCRTGFAAVDCGASEPCLAFFQRNFWARAILRRELALTFRLGFMVSEETAVPPNMARISAICVSIRFFCASNPSSAAASISSDSLGCAIVSRSPEYISELLKEALSNHDSVTAEYSLGGSEGRGRLRLQERRVISPKAQRILLFSSAIVVK